MTFMDEALESSVPIWDACAASPFVQEMKTGELAPVKFKSYMIQDSIYLKHYARMYGKAIYHAGTLREIQLFYAVLNFVTDTESAVRLRYLKEYGLTDERLEHIRPLPENQNYIDFMEQTAQGGDVCEILMAVLPCMLSYSFVFQKIAADPAAGQSQYWDFIEDYASDAYAKDCGRWTLFADEKCGGLPPRTREKLAGIFRKASLLELDFWKMAYKDPVLGRYEG